MSRALRNKISDVWCEKLKRSFPLKAGINTPYLFGGDKSFRTTGVECLEKQKEEMFEGMDRSALRLRGCGISAALKKISKKKNSSRATHIRAG